MAIKSSIFQKKDDKLTAVDSGKNPKTLAEKEQLGRIVQSGAIFKEAYNDYVKSYGNKKGALSYDAWKKDNNITGDFLQDEDQVLNFFGRYRPDMLADVTVYYDGFKAKPSTSASTTKSGQTYIPEKVKPVVNTSPSTSDTDINTTPETDSSTGNTGTGAGNAGTDGSNGAVDNQYSQTDSAVDSALKLIESYNRNMDATRNQTADRMWQMIESYWKENPLETDYGKAILDYYGVLGDNSANAVNAATAGENAGNIDSFAAANAERQRMSRYGQGVQTIMGMSSDRFKNMVSSLDSIGVNTNALFETQGKYGVGTAADYASNLYNTDASSTAAYNELMAALEGNKTYTYDLSDDGVTSLLKKAYNDLNPIGSDSTEIDWTATDSDQWTDVIQNVLKAYPNSGLTEGYLRDMIEKIIKGTQAEAGTTGVANANTVDVSKLPAWLQSIVLATTK